MGVEKRRSTLSVLFYIKRQTLLKNGEALDRLMDKDFDIKRLEQVRDVFAFCCFTFVALTKSCLIINKLQSNNRSIGNGLETTCLHHFA